MEAVKEMVSYQIFSHGLCTDVYGETGQLGWVLELPVKCPQVHGQKVILGEGWLLHRTKPEIIIIREAIDSLVTF